MHGRGGAADSLLHLAKLIDMHATLIGFEGTVIYQGERRFFIRYPDGSSDLAGLEQATIDLALLIPQVLQQYQLNEAQVTILGYSNGANLALNLLRRYENVPYQHIILFHPTTGRPEISFKQQPNCKVLLTYGAADPFVTENDFDMIAAQLKTAVISVNIVKHKSGHKIREEELAAARQLLNQL